jgi:peroxiredoxin
VVKEGLADPRKTHPDLRPMFEAAEQRWLEHWLAGPSRRRWTEIPLQSGDPAPDLELMNSDARGVALSSLWEAGPALLIFWRHWGCGCGVDRAELLRQQYPALIDAGANVVVIGQGDPGRAAWYREAFQVPCPVLVDPDESAYRAYGLLEMGPWVLSGQAGMERRELQATILRHRRRGRPVADNPFLLPGEFVVNQAGRLVLTYRYQYCDNAPDVDTLVASIDEARSSG